MKLYLGIVYDSDGDMVNHRSLVKVLFNPFLRMIGLQIGTQYSKGILGKAVLAKCEPRLPSWEDWKYTPPTDGYVKKERIFI